MARTNFENLRVYRLSEDLADQIWDIALDNLAPQLNSYLKSIGSQKREVEE